LRFIFTGMKDHIHISLPHFLEVIEKRLDQYREALFGTRQSFGMNHAMLTAKLHNMQTMKQLIDQNELTKGELWGYGINHISDGEQEYSSADVEDIKRTGGQNKHHEPFRNLLVLLFKVEKGAFWVSTFAIDSCAPTVNSTINTRYSLSELENVRMRTRAQAIFIDIYFTGVTKPVSFQVETYHLARNYHSGKALANYYIGSIKMMADKPGKPKSMTLTTDTDHLPFAPKQSFLDITGHTRKVLLYLFKQRGEKGNTYGNISGNIGLDSAEKSEEICSSLYANGFAEWHNDRVFITDIGRQWVERFHKEQDDKIREFVYDDYDFALLHFLYEQDMPVRFEEFPEILMDEAPKNTTGYPSMNLHYMLEIKFRAYIDNPINKYELNQSGRKYFEHIAKKKNFPLTIASQAKNKKNVSRIFVSYARVNQQWLQKVKVHLQALKNYGQIEFEYWDDTQLIAGDKWETMIAQELDGADVAILLISTEFFASEFIKAKELAPLLKNAEAKGTRIIPVVISHSIFSNTQIAQFQAVNDPLLPLNSLMDAEQDKILVKMCHDIEKHLLKVVGGV
jgi:hypothetical protein